MTATAMVASTAMRTIYVVVRSMRIVTTTVTCVIQIMVIASIVKQMVMLTSISEIVNKVVFWMNTVLMIFGVMIINAAPQDHILL